MVGGEDCLDESVRLAGVFGDEGFCFFDRYPVGFAVGEILVRRCVTFRRDGRKGGGTYSSLFVPI